MSSGKPSEILFPDALNLLRQLIATPSFSREEQQSASVIESFLRERGVEVKRDLNNVWCTNKFFDPAKAGLLLNSHHDTVKPNKAYTLDPFSPVEQNGKIFGLGSNDAGGALVSLIAAFLHFHESTDLKYNLILAATAEEEISGPNGIEHAIQAIPQSDCAIVGEPTLMQMAVAEKGLMVIDCVAYGKAGHAARDEGVNAISKAITDIDWINRFQFPKISPLLGPVKMSVTSIETPNKTHNIVPSECRFIVDVRINELYTPEEILDTIGRNVQSDVHPRSTRLKSSAIPLDHPLVKAGLSLGLTYYGSPTTSDKALMPFPALKIGPGDSARSHTADEFIFIEEIKKGIETYVSILKQILL